MSVDAEIIDQWTGRIRQAYQAGDRCLTRSLMEEAIRETDAAASLLEGAGMIEYSFEDYEASIRLLESAMFEIALTITGQLTLANAWLKVGNESSARTTARFLVEFVDRVPCSLLPDLTHLLSSLKEYELAIEVCRTAFERHPDDDNAIFGAAFYMHRVGYPLPLIYNTMAKAVDLAPESDLYRLNFAVVCCSMERWQEAYAHACRIPQKGLGTIPCSCMKEQLRDLFARFDDTERLSLIEGSA